MSVRSNDRTSRACSVSRFRCLPSYITSIVTPGKLEADLCRDLFKSQFGSFWWWTDTGSGTAIVKTSHFGSARKNRVDHVFTDKAGKKRPHYLSTLKPFADIYQMHGVVDFFCRNPRFHHHGSNVQDFSRQLQITSSQKWIPWKTQHLKLWQHRDCFMASVWLPCTLLSCLQYPQLKGSWSAMSPSETAPTQISLCGRQMTGIVCVDRHLGLNDC